MTAIDTLKGILEKAKSETPEDGLLVSIEVPVYVAEAIAYAQQGWIPVTERLPEDEEPILFSTKTGRVHQGRFHKDCSLNQWYSSLDKMRAFNNVVNAWMPLPTPWKGEEDANS